MNTQNFLLELGTEELPYKSLKQLSTSLSHNLTNQLSEFNISYGKVDSFSTPRRLAVLVHDLQLQQDNQIIERKGPVLGASNQAIEGFARSCGVSKGELSIKKLAKAEYYFFNKEEKGLETRCLLENIVQMAIKKIPIDRAMRWGVSDFSFVRPVHWLVLMLDTDVVPATVMGLTSGNETHGMRWTGEQKFCIDNAKDYQKTLMEKAQIEVDFDTRKTIIRKQVIQIANDNNAIAVIDESLLDEVCALVEHPCAFSGKFDENFLVVPKEALISAMKSHQKYFHMVNNSGELLPAFISVANIESSDLSVIISGNERVIRPRLSDSEFFWEQDKANSLESKLPKLDHILFMKSLGSMGDKAKRISNLAGYIADKIGVNKDNCIRAGLLAKVDLVTDMVGEFTDLQGVMGCYYANNDGEDSAVATAIGEHYHPRFSGDTLPLTKEGLCVSIADKIDNIVGIYGVGHKPTGSKDPYALRRAGLGLLRMIIESKLKLDLFALISQSTELYQFENINDNIKNFILDRLGAYYQKQGIDKLTIKAAQNTLISAQTYVYDLHLRIQALHVFVQDKNFKSLVEVYKRITNIFKDCKPSYVFSGDYKSAKFCIIDKNTDQLVDFSTVFDKELADALEKVKQMVKLQEDYSWILQELLKLKPVIDNFFDNVMVLDNNLKIRKARLALVNNIVWLFDKFARFSDLSK